MWLLLPLAAYFGYIFGVRRERGAHERVAELNTERVTEVRSRGGITLRRIQLRR
jgi:hypothetical protein